MGAAAAPQAGAVASARSNRQRQQAALSQINRPVSGSRRCQRAWWLMYSRRDADDLSGRSPGRVSAAGGDGLRGAGGRYFIYAIKIRGTKAGRCIDDPASRREPSGLAWGLYAPDSLWRPIHGYGEYPCTDQVREGHSAAG